MRLFHSLAFVVFGVTVLACEPPPEVCDDGLDNDNNGLIDCEDQKVCGEEPACVEGLNCDDGIDNDFDGLLDCESPACAQDPNCQEEISQACGGLPFLPPADTNFESSTGPNSLSRTSDVLAGSCTGGLGAQELVVFTGVGLDVEMTITLIPDPKEGENLGLYVRSVCEDAASELVCADENGEGESEVVRFPLGAGEAVFVVVDGATAADAGAFTLLLESN